MNIQTFNEPIILTDVLYCTNNFESGVDPVVVAEQNCILATASTPHDAVLDGMKSRVCINSTVIANGGQHGSAIRANLINSKLSPLSLSVCLC